MPAIKKCLENGIFIVITTASEEGAVYPTYDYEGSAYDLINKGVLLGSDSDSKKARVKLAVMIASGKKNIHSKIIKSADICRLFYL